MHIYNLSFYLFIYVRVCVCESFLGQDKEILGDYHEKVFAKPMNVWLFPAGVKMNSIAGTQTR